MTYYDLTCFQNATNWLLHIDCIMTIDQGGLLAAFIILIIAVILFAAMVNWGTRQAAIASFFITATISIFMFTLQWMSLGIFIGVLVLLLIATFLAIIME